MGVPKSLVRLVVFCYNGFNRPIGIEPITSCLELEPFLEILFDYDNRFYGKLYDGDRTKETDRNG